MANNQPKKVGYYWARWIECEPDTEDHDIFEARDHYQPVEVTQDDPNTNLPFDQQFRVFVLGFAGSQNLNFFEWGPFISDLHPETL